MECYTIWNVDDDGNRETKSLKVKGISLKTNHLVPSDYKDIIENNTIKQGKNINLQMKS